VKTVSRCRKRRELLGAHVTARKFTELIPGPFRIARALEGTEADLQAPIFPHPTLSNECTRRRSPPTVGRCTFGRECGSPLLPGGVERVGGVRCVCTWIVRKSGWSRSISVVC